LLVLNADYYPGSEVAAHFESQDAVFVQASFDFSDGAIIEYNPGNDNMVGSRGSANQVYPHTGPGPPAHPDSFMRGQQQWLVQYISSLTSPGLLLKQVLHAPKHAQVAHTAPPFVCPVRLCVCV